MALPIAMGAASIGGDIMSFFGQQQTNAANAKQAQLNRDFQERMSDTAYQRTVADMKKAGINPMLATQMGGASTPLGNTATMQNPAQGMSGSAGRAADAFNDMANSVTQRKAQLAQAALTDAQAEQVRTTTLANLAKIQSETGLNNANAKQLSGLFQANLDNLNARTRLLGGQSMATDYANQVSAASIEYRKAKEQADMMGGFASAGEALARIQNLQANTQATKYGFAKEKAESNFYSSNIGKWVPGVSSAADVVGKITGLFKP